LLSQDFKEFIQSLNANDVQYLIIGGYAVAVHGHPRYTKDLDVWLESSETNALKVVKALQDFGFGSLGLSDKDFVEPELVIQLGYPPNRIDLLTYADGVAFTDCYQRRMMVEIGGVSVNFIGLEELKKNKLASGRPQDLADLSALE
jgi:predicted nucleotidyltransferase